MINTADNAVTTINSSTFSGPYAIAITPNGATAYVVNYGSGTVSVIDFTNSNAVTKINGFISPRAIAIAMVQAPVPPGAPTGPLSAPTGLSATGTNTQVSLTWTAPSSGGNAITGYDVYEGTTSGAESSTPVNTSPLGATTTTYTVTGLTNGTTYYFTVKAINTAGSSGASNEASATPANTTPATLDGRGYWLVGSDGGVFSFGDAMASGPLLALPTVMGVPMTVL